MRMTNGEINRLGDRLRTAGSLEAADLERLQVLRLQYEGALHQAQERIGSSLPNIGAPTSRLKTVQTLVGKLRREPTMNLTQVQDIAGIRVVRPMGLTEQTEAASHIASLFEHSKVVDRRERPSFGYRALHIVVRVEGLPVEVQVRTAMQDQWAQILERMADHWGRQIRYGEPANQPGAPAGTSTRSFVLDLVRRLSPLIEACEESGTGRNLKLRGDFYCAEVDGLLRELSKIPVVGSAA